MVRAATREIWWKWMKPLGQLSQLQPQGGRIVAVAAGVEAKLRSSAWVM